MPDLSLSIIEIRRKTMTYYNGDNLQAFDGLPIVVDIEFEEDAKDVSKAIAVFNDGIVCKEFVNPQFPLEINLEEKDTVKLPYHVIMKLVVFDTQGRRKQCDGSLEFILEKGAKICEG